MRCPFSVFFAPRLRRRLHYADWLKNVSDIAAYPTTSFRLGCLFTLIQWKTQTCIRKHVVGCKKGELNTVAFQIQRFPRFSSCKQQNRFQNTGYGSRRVTCHVTTLAAKWISINFHYQDAREEQQYSSSIGIHFAASVVTWQVTRRLPYPVFWKRFCCLHEENRGKRWIWNATVFSSPFLQPTTCLRIHVCVFHWISVNRQPKRKLVVG